MSRASALSFATRWIPDSVYLQMLFFKEFHRFLHWNRAGTFSEKIQWLKLYDRREVLHALVDKVAASEHIASLVGPEYLIPVLGVYDSEKTVDASRLPTAFVVKASHSSGQNLIVRKRDEVDWRRVRGQFRNWLDTDFYLRYREWAYYGVPRRLVVQELLTDADGAIPEDFKFYCFGGEPRVVGVHRNRFSDHRRDFYSVGWSPLPFSLQYPRGEADVPKPAALSEMVEVARALAAGHSFVRVDLYCVRGRVYVGELTFYPAAGLKRFSPEAWDRKLGDWLELPVHAGGPQRT